MKSNAVVAYAPIIIKLLQGPLFSDELTTWNLLLKHVGEVQTHFAQIGLEVRVHEEDGFAYLHQPPLEDDEGHTLSLPRLVRGIARIIIRRCCVCCCGNNSISQSQATWIAVLVSSPKSRYKTCYFPSCPNALMR